MKAQNRKIGRHAQQYEGIKENIFQNLKKSSLYLKET